MGLLKKFGELLDGLKDPRFQKYYDAWDELAPSRGLEPLERLPGDIAKVIELSEFLTNDTHEARFVCRIPFEDFDIYTFYLFRFFSAVSMEDESTNCFVGVVKHPFNGGDIVVRNQKNKRLRDRGSGLNFEHKGFSEETWVMAEPERLAYQFFHPRMIEHFVPFWAYQFQAIPGYLMFFKYMPWDLMAFDLLKEPNYEFKSVKGFNNVVKKFFPGMLELIPNSLQRTSGED